MSLHLDHATLGTGAAQSLGQRPNLPQVPPPPERRPRWGGLAKTGIQASAVLGVLVFVFGFILERAAPYPWKPSTMLGAYGGNIESAQLLTAIDAKRAEVAMQQQEAARAQQEVIALQAANERATRAYDALFQRGTALAQQWGQGAQQTLLLDAQMRIKGLESRAEVAGAKDTLAFVCDLGAIFLQTPDCGNQVRASAESDRSAISAEIVNNYRKQSAAIATSLRDWAMGLPDPAELHIIQADAARIAISAAQRAPVPISPVYPR